MSSAVKRLFSFPAMLITTLCVSPFFASLDIQQGGPVMRDPDIWWHLRNAETLLSTHHFIRFDAYSFTTRGLPWMNPEWLSEIPYYLGFRLLGERGLFLVMLGAVELVIAGILLLCYRRSSDVKAAFLATWVAVLFAAINIGLRTILFGWLCFIIEMLLLESFRRGRDHLWLLVPLFALWINLHGSWLIGVVFLFLFIVSGWVQFVWGSIQAARWTQQQKRKLLSVALACIAALLINPYGWRLVAYPFQLSFQHQLMVDFVEEWASVDFQTFYGKIVFAVVAAMFVFTLARRRPWPLHELLFSLVAFYSGLTHKRFLFLAGIVFCPILAVELKDAVFAPYDPKRDKPIIAAAIMVGFLGFAILHVPSSASLRAAETPYFPVHALPTLEATCANQRVFNRFEWGGYLIWNARNIPVFFDSREDIFEHYGVFADGVEAMHIHNSLGILDRYRIGCVLLNSNDSLTYLLRNTPGWHLQFEDPIATLLVRTPLTPSSDRSPIEPPIRLPAH